MRNSRIQEQRLAEVTRRRIEALAATLPAAAESPPEEVPSAGAPEAVREAVREDRAPGRHARRPVPVGGRLAGWVGDRVPAPLQGRVHLGAAQLGLVALVVAVGLVATSWWMVRAAGREEAVAPPRPLTSSAVPVVSPATSVADSPPSDDPTVVVDVAGRVRQPGIAVLPTGSRVVDALEAAGGVRRGVDLTTLNLARVLVDGEQVLVGRSGAAGVAGPPGAAAEGESLVSINTADQVTLETLPGVGPVTAGAILAWREEHGAFAAVEELLEVSGIGPATLAELMPHITL